MTQRGTATEAVKESVVEVVEERLSRLKNEVSQLENTVQKICGGPLPTDEKNLEDRPQRFVGALLHQLGGDLDEIKEQISSQIKILESTFT